MYDFLRGKRPDYFPEKIRPLLGKKGQITTRALQELSYWELALIGFSDTEKQLLWRRAYSDGLEKHHEFMRKINVQSETRFLDELMADIQFRKQLKEG